MSTQVGQIILQQLGGNRFIAMTGAKSFAGGKFPKGEGLSFRLPGTLAMIITLNDQDLYDIQLLKGGQFRGGKWIDPKTVGSAEDVFVEDLRRTFTCLTGLDTSL